MYSFSDQKENGEVSFCLPFWAKDCFPVFRSLIWFRCSYFRFVVPISGVSFRQTDQTCRRFYLSVNVLFFKVRIFHVMRRLISLRKKYSNLKKEGGGGNAAS